MHRQEAFLLSVDFDRLRTFVAAAAAGSFTRVAVARGLTTAAISQQVRALEEQLGVPLFERVGHRIRLSPHGRELVQGIRPALQQIEDSLATLHHSFRARAGIVRVGMPRAFGRRWVRERLASLLTEHPELRVHFRFGPVDTLERRLVDGELDLALLIRDPRLGGLAGRPLVEASLVAVAAPSYRHSHGALGTEEDLQRARWATYDGQHRLLERWWKARFGARLRPPSTVIVQAADVELLLDIALAGVAVCVLPSYLVDAHLEHGRLVRIVVAGEHPTARVSSQTIQLAWRATPHLPRRVLLVATALSGLESSGGP